MADNQLDLAAVDWTKIPPPDDDGAAHRLLDAEIPDIELPSTDGGLISLATLAGRTIVYAYPMTGRPDVALPDGWDAIPGARGCTPQSCAFRDHFAELKRSGASYVFGVSTQDTGYQREAVDRLHLPFPLLSDAALGLTRALKLPTMEVGGRTLIKRVTLVVDDGRIATVFYPVFPPDRNAADVIAWLQANAKPRAGE